MSSPSFSVVLFTAAPPTFSPETGTPAGAVKVDGREALLRSVELFLNRDPIKQVLLCFTSEFAEEGKRKFGGHLAFGGVKLLTAGPRWIDQCAGALEKLSTETTHILVHDVARPAVAYDDIDALLEAAPKHAIACLSAVQRNALFELDESGAPVAVHPARQFAQMLLPMSFSRAAFEQLAKSKQDPHASQIALVKGSHLNVRVSGGHDAALVGAMLKMLPKAKVKPPSSPFEEAQW